MASNQSDAQFRRPPKSAKTDITKSRCICESGSCAHHKAQQPCPNFMVVPVQVVHDTDTGEPIIGSECGMCQICWDNLYDLMEEDALTDA